MTSNKVGTRDTLILGRDTLTFRDVIVILSHPRGTPRGIRIALAREEDASRFENSNVRCQFPRDDDESPAPAIIQRANDR
jgi:hypothetical protein